jgi:hypothetical protein
MCWQAPLPAATASASLGVSVTVAPGCNVAAAPGKPQVTCTTPAPYTISVQQLAAQDLAPAADVGRLTGSDRTIVTTITY